MGPATLALALAAFLAASPPNFTPDEIAEIQREQAARRASEPRTYRIEPEGTAGPSPFEIASYWMVPAGVRITSASAGLDSEKTRIEIANDPEWADAGPGARPTGVRVRAIPARTPSPGTHTISMSVRDDRGRSFNATWNFRVQFQPLPEAPLLERAARTDLTAEELHRLVSLAGAPEAPRRRAALAALRDVCDRARNLTLDASLARTLTPPGQQPDVIGDAGRELLIHTAHAPLTTALTSQDGEDVLAAIAVLEKGSHRALPRFEKLVRACLTHPDPQVRTRAGTLVRQAGVPDQK